MSIIVTHRFYYRKEKITHVYVILVLALRKRIWEQVRKELAGSIVMRKQTRIHSPWEQKGRSGSGHHSVRDHFHQGTPLANLSDGKIL